MIALLLLALPRPAGADVMTFSPDPDGRGTVWREGTVSYSDTRNAASGTVSTEISVGQAMWVVDSKYKVMRSFLPFDTSELPDNATITDACLHVSWGTRALNSSAPPLSLGSIIRGSARSQAL